MFGTPLRGEAWQTPRIAAAAKHVALPVMLLATFWAFAPAPLAWALDRSWDGGGTSTHWFDNANWSPDGNPGGDALFIGDLPGGVGAQTLVDAGASIISLSLTQGAKVEVPDGVLLTINGVADVDDAELKLSEGGSVRFRGATHIADATDFNNNAPRTSIIVDALVEIGDLSVEADEDFNWDGQSTNGSTTIVGPSGDLRLSVENVDLFTSDTFDGTLTLNSGSVSVNVSDGHWIMNGDLTLNSTGNDEAILAGSSVDFGDDGANEQSDGALIVVTGNGPSRIDSQVSFQSNARLELHQGASLLTGDIHLDGAIQFTLDQGVNPEEGASFTIVDAEGVVSGFFTDWDLPELDPGLSWNIDYSTSSATLVVTDDLPGDYNGDSQVDAVDYATWREGLGTTFNSAQYSEWRNSFGRSLPGGASRVLSTPEPGCMLLLLIGCCALSARRRCR